MKLINQAAYNYEDMLNPNNYPEGVSGIYQGYSDGSGYADF